MQSTTTTRRYGTLFVFQLVAIVGAIGISNTSLACSCPMKSFDERFEQAEFVFAAEVVATQLMVPADAKYRFSTDRVDISIGPAKSYKGDPSKLEALHTYADGASCGAGLTAGKTYTFFVKSDGLVLLCGGVVQDREWPEFWQWLTERGLE